MASNSFGQIFRWTTWGESHGRAMGVVIDGCPAGLYLTEEEINRELVKRAPGGSSLTSPRKEPDYAEIYSGIFEGQTTGAPLSIIIHNRDADSSKYESIKNFYRPGHSNFTYLQKYGVFDYRGGGRSSARETVCRVAAGAVAKKLLTHFDIEFVTFLTQVGKVKMSIDNYEELSLIGNPLICPDERIAKEMKEEIEKAKSEGDSIGGVIEFVIRNLPLGLGDPVYEKLEANLAKAMMSLPASKGFEVGQGFQASAMKGSEHNDSFERVDDKIAPRENNAGGLLGGITTGRPIVGRVAFKPTSSIAKKQETVTLSGDKSGFQLPEGSRHDPCVALRAVPIVEAMGALVVADALLMQRCSKL